MADRRNRQTARQPNRQPDIRRGRQREGVTTTPTSPPTALLPTFTATRTPCVLERRPTQAEPCFTASSAYSVWWMRPCGDQVVMSLSYWLRNCSDRGWGWEGVSRVESVRRVKRVDRVESSVKSRVKCQEESQESRVKRQPDSGGQHEHNQPPDLTMVGGWIETRNKK